MSHCWLGKPQPHESHDFSFSPGLSLNPVEGGREWVWQLVILIQRRFLYLLNFYSSYLFLAHNAVAIIETSPKPCFQKSCAWSLRRTNLNETEVCSGRRTKRVICHSSDFHSSTAQHTCQAVKLNDSSGRATRWNTFTVFTQGSPAAGQAEQNERTPHHHSCASTSQRTSLCPAFFISRSSDVVIIVSENSYFLSNWELGKNRKKYENNFKTQR